MLSKSFLALFLFFYSINGLGLSAIALEQFAAELFPMWNTILEYMNEKKRQNNETIELDTAVHNHNTHTTDYQTICRNLFRANHLMKHWQMNNEQKKQFHSIEIGFCVCM